MEIFCIIAMISILHISWGYIAQTSYMFGLSEFDGYAVNNFDFRTSIGLAECLMTCFARSPTSCLSVFYHATDRACKIGGEVDIGSAPSTDTGWTFYGAFLKTMKGNFKIRQWERETDGAIGQPASKALELSMKIYLLKHNNNFH